MKLSEHIVIEKRGIKMAFRLNKNYVFCLMAEALLSALTPYIAIYFSAKLVDAMYLGAGVKILVLYASLTVGLTFLFSLLRQWNEAVTRKEAGVFERAQEWMHSEKSMEMAYESIEERDVRLLRDRVRTETQTGFGMFAFKNGFQNFVTSGIQIVASVGLSWTFFANPSISVAAKLALMFGVVFTIGVGAYSSTKVGVLLMEFWDTASEFNVIVPKVGEYRNDYNNGMVMRLYHLSELTRNMERKVKLAFWRKGLKYGKKEALWGLPQILLNNLLKYAVYLILVAAALEGAVSVGSIAKYVSCMMLLLAATTEIAHNVPQALNNHHYLKRYFSYFDIPNKMYQGSLTVEKRDDNEYDVEFRDVSFRYPNTEEYALRHVNLKFRIGEKLAVVGRNGSGKTTFIKLLCRLYDPTEGQILLNGVDIRKYDYDEYMSIFSVVFQDFKLLAFTLGQNVATAKEYDAERVKKCLSEVGFEERLSAMPQGVDTYLYQNYSKDGVEISGGEAQKIALARALYKDAPFIILDEPTAALDPVSEYEIYSKFNEIAGDKTAVYISHRLASCRFCDKIAVFENGQIVQKGGHEELLGDESGKYYELWNAQAQYYAGA